MCIIIHKPADKRISKRTLRRAYHANQHGWGLVAKDAEGKLTMCRGLGRVGGFIEAYREVEDQEVLIHCRIATSGEVDIANTHPFEVTKGVWLMHNGILSEKVTGKRDDKTKSDTWYLANKILRPLFEKDKQHLFLQFPEELGFTKDLETYIESYSTNKVAIMSSYGPTIIAGKHKGEEREGVWYSNASAFRTSAEYKRRTSKTNNLTTSKTTTFYGSHQGGDTGTRTSTSVSSSATGPGGHGAANGRRTHHGGGSTPNHSSATAGGGQYQSQPNGNGTRVSSDPSHGTGGAQSTSSVSQQSGRPNIPDRGQLDLAQVEVADDLRIIGDLSGENAEAVRYEMAWTYGEILHNYSIEELKQIIAENQDGIAEVLYYALHNELFFEGLENTLYVQEGTSKEKETHDYPGNSDIELEAGMRAAKVFEPLWNLCDDHYRNGKVAQKA